MKHGNMTLPKTYILLQNKESKVKGDIYLVYPTVALYEYYTVNESLNQDRH